MSKTKNKHKKSGGKKTEKLSKKARKAAEREAKKKARRGDGSFPDVLFVMKEDDGTLHAFDGATLDGVVANAKGAVYKMRRVANVVVNRKIAR